VLEFFVRVSHYVILDFRIKIWSKLKYNVVFFERRSLMSLSDKDFMNIAQIPNDTKIVLEALPNNYQLSIFEVAVQKSQKHKVQTSSRCYSHSIVLGGFELTS
jgi:hypothetical protein